MTTVDWAIALAIAIGVGGLVLSLSLKKKRDARSAMGTVINLVTRRKDADGSED